MKFCYLLSATLATLAIASPIADPSPPSFAELDARARGGIRLPAVNRPPAAPPAAKRPTAAAKATTATATAAPVFDDTPEFTTAKAAQPDLQANQFLWFTLEWPLGIAVGDGDLESQSELQQLQQKLGFEHIGVVMGQVTETTTGRGKNQKTKRDFTSTLLHMTKQNVNPGDTELKNVNWKANAKQHLKVGGVTSAKKIDAAKKAAKNYVASNPIYSVDTNSCNDFAQAVIAAVR